ncbi:MAG: hypothetical protein AB7V19_01170 [Candidatus Bipolaricaulia bacterium]
MSVVKALQLALSKREKVERMISALDELKNEGTITEERYEALMRDYMDHRIRIAEELSRVREEVEKNLAQQKAQLEACTVELREIELRLRSGTVNPTESSRARTRAETRQFHLRAAIAQTAKLLAAETSEEVGGYIDIALDSERTSRSPVRLPAIRTSNTKLLSYVELVQSPSDLRGPGLRLVIPFACLAMFISLFLRWAGVGGGYVELALAGTSSGGTLAVGILTALFSLGAWLLVHPLVRGGIQVFMGAISFLVAALLWIPDVVGNRHYGLSFREGFFLFMLAAVLIVVAGVTALRERR